MSNAEIATTTPASPATLYGSDDPETITRKAVAIAEQLGPIIREKNLSVGISGKDYIKAEGWQLLGGLMGLSATTEWTRPIPDTWTPATAARPHGWEARVQIVTLDGRVVSSGEASCMRDESRWSDADDYTVRSMAQTRALGKAYRLGLGYVATLAGYEATPAEEIPSTVNAPATISRPSQARTPTSQTMQCPACGERVWDNRPKIESGEFSEKSPKFRCSSKSCDGTDADGEVVTDGKAGEPWVTWHEHYFDEDDSDAAHVDSPEMDSIMALVEQGQATEGQVLAVARGAARDAGVDQPTSLAAVSQLGPDVLGATLAKLGEKVAS